MPGFHKVENHGEQDDNADADDGPSAADLERFGDETAYCPDCGAEVWDQAEVCPTCHAYIGGNASPRLPVQNWFARRMVMVIAIVLVIAMLWWLL